MLVEALALEFKFDVHALPSFGPYPPHGLAVGKSRLDRFDRVAKVLCKHPKKEHDALLVHWFMAKPAEVTGVAIDRPIF